MNATRLILPMEGGYIHEGHGLCTQSWCLQTIAYQGLNVQHTIKMEYKHGIQKMNTKAEEFR